METNNIQNTMSVSAFIECKGPVLLTDEHKSYAKRTERTIRVSGLASSSSPPKIHKTVENLRKQHGKERTRVVYQRC